MISYLVRLHSSTPGRTKPNLSKARVFGRFILFCQESRFLSSPVEYEVANLPQFKPSWVRRIGMAWEPLWNPPSYSPGVWLNALYFLAQSLAKPSTIEPGVWFISTIEPRVWLISTFKPGVWFISTIMPGFWHLATIDLADWSYLWNEVKDLISQGVIKWSYLVYK